MNKQGTFDGDVTLMDAKISGNLEMGTSRFGGAVDATTLNVKGDLFMDGKATFDGDLTLAGAKVSGNLEMGTSQFDGAVDATTLGVGGDLFMDGKATFDGDLTLAGAKINGNLEMETSRFAGAVDATNVNVGGDLFMNERATFDGAVTLVGAKVDNTLDVDHAAATSINLSGAEVREFLLGGLGWQCAGGKPPATDSVAPSGSSAKVSPTHWRLGDASWRNFHCHGMDAAIFPTLILRNTHVADFQDSADAWPPAMDLEGFRYDRLGGLGGSGRDDMRNRSPEEWTDWLARDRDFSTQPYTELSSVLAAAGHRDTADAIQLAGRERERGETCKAWSRPASCAWLSFLSSAAGYGIGLYTFRVLWWVTGLTVLGAVILWFSPNARRHSWPWLFGASLHRLLPIIELSKEFTNFFDNPPPQFDEEPNLNRFQVAYFAGHAVAGWILSLILLAAMSGITQKS